jgi:hypothetical protein
MTGAFSVSPFNLELLVAIPRSEQGRRLTGSADGRLLKRFEICSHKFQTALSFSVAHSDWSAGPFWTRLRRRSRREEDATNYQGRTRASNGVGGLPLSCKYQSRYRRHSRRSFKGNAEEREACTLVKMNRTWRQCWFSGRLYIEYAISRLLRP